VYCGARRGPIRPAYRLTKSERTSNIHVQATRGSPSTSSIFWTVELLDVRRGVSQDCRRTGKSGHHVFAGEPAGCRTARKDQVVVPVGYETKIISVSDGHAPFDLWFVSMPEGVPRRSALTIRHRPCLERAHCSRIGFTEWPHENQTLTKFRG
jgi:hypothetical protein